MSDFIEDGSTRVSCSSSSFLSSVARLVIVVGELSDESQTDIHLRRRLVEDLGLSWNASLSHCDLNEELKSFVTKSPITKSTTTGERTLVYQSPALHAEILVNVGINGVNDKLVGLRSDSKASFFTLIVYVGVILPPTGIWLLRDGPYLPNTSGCSLKSPCPTVFEISGRPSADSSSTTSRKEIDAFCGQVLEVIRLEQKVKDPELKPSSGAPRFYDRPTMYIFPSGQGTSAFFGMGDFGLLADAGYGRNPLCWEFIRRRERLDVLLLTQLGIHNLFGIKSMLEKMKKMDESSRPKIGHVFLNSHRMSEGNSAITATKKDLIAKDEGVNDFSNVRNQTMLNWRKEAMSLVRDLEQLKVDPTPCTSQGIESHACLYHKVGVGSTCIDMMWPNNDEHLKQFLETWKDESTKVDFRDGLPAWDAFSVCAIIRWIPAPHGKPVRVLLTGGAPESVVLSRLEKLRRKAKLGKSLGSETCLCKDAYRYPGTDCTENGTMKKLEGLKKDNRGGRISSKEKHVAAKESVPKQSGVVGSGSMVAAQREANKQHTKPPSGVSFRDAKRREGAKGHIGVKMEAGQAKEMCASRRVECDDLDRCVGSKRVDALRCEVEQIDHALKKGDHHVAESNKSRSMKKRANRAPKSAKGSSGPMQNSWNVSPIEETKKDAGKSIVVHASEEIKENAGKSIVPHASEETEEIKEDAGKSVVPHASEETEEIKENAGKSIVPHASEETEEIKEDAGKSIVPHASEEIKEDAGKSVFPHASEETEEIKEDACKVRIVPASEEIEGDGKFNDVYANKEMQDVGKSSCADEETKEDFGKSSNAFESKVAEEDIGKSSDVKARGETEENYGRSSSLESKEGKEDIVTGSAPGSVYPTSFGSKTLSKDESGKVEEGLGPLEEEQRSKDGDGEQTTKNSKEASDREYERYPEKAKELTESDVELHGTKEEPEGLIAQKETDDPVEDAVIPPFQVKEDPDIPPAKNEVVPPFEVLAIKDNMDLPPAEEGVAPPSELPITMEDQDESPLEYAVVKPFEVAAAKEHPDIPPAEEGVVPPSELPAANLDHEEPLAEDGVVPPCEVRVVGDIAKEDSDLLPANYEVKTQSEVSADKDGMDIPPAEELVVPPSELPVTVLYQDESPLEDAVVRPFEVAASKEHLDIPPGKGDVAPPSEVSIAKDMSIPPAEEEVVSPSGMPGTMDAMDISLAEGGVVPPSEVPATKDAMEITLAKDGMGPPSGMPAAIYAMDIRRAEDVAVEVVDADEAVVHSSERNATKMPKKTKRIPSAGERCNVTSKRHTPAEKFHKTRVEVDDLQRADSLDDLPSNSKTDQLPDYKLCSQATPAFSSTVAAAHDLDFDVEILRGGCGNDFPAMNPFQGVAYEEDIFAVSRSLANDCDLCFDVEPKAGLNSDVEQDSLDGDGFDPGQAWEEPMNLPEPEPPKHLNDAKVGDDSNGQKKKANVCNYRKPFPGNIERSRKSKPARETPPENQKNKRIVSDGTLGDKVTVQKSTKVEATRTGLSESLAPVPASKMSEPKVSIHHNQPANEESVYFTVAFIPGRGEPQYVSKLFFRQVRARYYILSSVSHELSVLDGLLEAKEEWEEQEGRCPVSVIPTHGSNVLEEWVVSRSEKLLRLNVDVRKAVDDGVTDEKDAFDAFSFEL